MFHYYAILSTANDIRFFSPFNTHPNLTSSTTPRSFFILQKTNTSLSGLSTYEKEYIVFGRIIHNKQVSVEKTGKETHTKMQFLRT